MFFLNFYNNGKETEKKSTKIKALGNFPKQQQIDDDLSTGQTRKK